MYIMAGLLAIRFVCNLFVKAVHHRFHMQPEADGALTTAAKAGAATAARLPKVFGSLCRNTTMSSVGRCPRLKIATAVARQLTRRLFRRKAG